MKKEDEIQIPSPSTRIRNIITVLQFFVGGLVTFGGAAFARSGTYPIGTLLGSVHFAIGLIGLFAGYAFLKRQVWSTRFLIIINSLTIAYSAFAETLAEIYAYLPRGINDALIGTIIAIIVSAIIVYVVSSFNESNRTKGNQRQETGVGGVLKVKLDQLLIISAFNGSTYSCQEIAPWKPNISEIFSFLDAHLLRFSDFDTQPL